MAHLTALGIERIKATDKRQELADGNGLYLSVHPSGTKTWALRFRMPGEKAKQKLTIGPYPEVGLVEARRKAAVAREGIAEGKDPRDVRAVARAKAARAVREERRTAETTFADLAERYLKQHAEPFARSFKDIEHVLLRRVGPHLGKLPAQELRRRDVAEMVSSVVIDHGPVAGRHALKYCRRVYRWSAGQGLIEMDPTIGVPMPVGIIRRERVLTDDELRRVWIATGEGGIFGAFVRGLLLTGARRGEIADLRWPEIDLSAGEIVIPGERYKTARSHMIPMSRQARALFSGLPHGQYGDFVFSTTDGLRPISGFSKLKAILDRALDPPIDYTQHDLRRTVRSGLARLGIAGEVAERVLGHVVGGIEAHYNLHAYGREKREALQVWADHIEMVVNGRRRGRVLTFGRKAK